MIALFVLKLLAGITLMWLTMPRREVADGFFRIQMLVALGLSVLLVLLFQPDSFSSRAPRSVQEMVGVSASGQEFQRATWVAAWLQKLAFAAAVTAYPGHIFWKLGRRRPGTICIWLLGVLSLGALVFQSTQVLRSVPVWHQLLADLSSSAVLGATLTGMLLGHWYLTTPTMSLRPLKWFCPVLGLAALLRGVATGLSWYAVGWESADMVRGMWLGLRLCGGILVPAATALVVHRILRYRNTQSATGVLFAALILVFMGEMSAALLEQDLSVPF
ncbi:MAG: hypothetical protein RLZZ232_801 [Planctomycetota bacterium]|jgi:hypothetical protein